MYNSCSSHHSVPDKSPAIRIIIIVAYSKKVSYYSTNPSDYRIFSSLEGGGHLTRGGVYLKLGYRPENKISC